MNWSKGIYVAGKKKSERIWAGGHYSVKMSYQTQYEITAEIDTDYFKRLFPGVSTKPAIISYKALLSGCKEFCSYESKETSKGISLTETWYTYQEEMKTASKKYPYILFTVTGHGEDGGDYWRKYFKDGKMQSAIMQFSPFDKNL